MQDLTRSGVRARFPIFEHTTYANSCSQGALSVDVRRAYGEYLEGWDEHGAEWEHWVERAEAARAAFARLVGADPDEIAVTTSVSQAVSALVSALPLERGRSRIVISEFEFPTVGQIAHAQELRGAEVVHVRPGPDGRIPLERFAEAIDERTALVCCTAISYRTGYRLDVAEVARLAHEQGALCLADSYQAAGATPLDVRALDVDLLTAGTVKYLLASAGLAFMYVRGDLHERLLPTQTGWFADEDIFRMDISDYSPAIDGETLRRRDAARPEHLRRAGRDGHRRATWASQRSRPTCAGSSAACWRASTSSAQPSRRRVARASAARSSAWPRPMPPRSSRRSQRERIVTSERDSNLRISLHLYNVDEDVDRILEALSRHRELLSGPLS